jgi:hypothetical protein
MDGVEFFTQTYNQSVGAFDEPFRPRENCDGRRFCICELHVPLIL